MIDQRRFATTAASDSHKLLSRCLVPRACTPHAALGSAKDWVSGRGQYANVSLQAEYVVRWRVTSTLAASRPKRRNALSHISLEANVTVLARREQHEHGGDVVFWFLKIAWYSTTGHTQWVSMQQFVSRIHLRTVCWVVMKCVCVPSAGGLS